MATAWSSDRPEASSVGSPSVSTSTRSPPRPRMTGREAPGPKYVECTPGSPATVSPMVEASLSASSSPVSTVADCAVLLRPSEIGVEVIMISCSSPCCTPAVAGAAVVRHAAMHPARRVFWVIGFVRRRRPATGRRVPATPRGPPLSWIRRVGTEVGRVASARPFGRAGQAGGLPPAGPSGWRPPGLPARRIPAEARHGTSARCTGRKSPRSDPGRSRCRHDDDRRRRTVPRG